MEAILQQILERQLRDFRGTEIKGQIAVDDQLVNAVLAEFLAGAATPPTATDGPATPGKTTEATATPPIDVRQLLSWVTVRQLQYRTEAGRTVLELDLGV